MLNYVRLVNTEISFIIIANADKCNKCRIWQMMSVAGLPINKASMEEATLESPDKL
jgi:hypothetical protein